MDSEAATDPTGTVTGSARNVADLVRAAAARVPERTAIVAVERRLTWREVDGQVDAVAAGLRALDVAPGERVALLLGNTVEFVLAWFGALRAGLVAVPVNPGFTPSEVAYQLVDSGAQVAVVEPHPSPELVQVLGAVAHVVPVDGPDWQSWLAGPAGPPDPPGAGSGGEDLAALVYTSGTSGRPRGAMLSHRALLANLDQAATVAEPLMTGDDVVLLVLPMFHIYGLNAGLNQVAAHAATGVVADRFDPVDCLDLLVAEGVTNVVGAPPMYVAWSMLPGVAEGFAGVRMAVSGAAPLPPDVFRRMRQQTGQPVYEGYGLTETAPVLTTTLASAEPQPGSIGRPVPGVELRLVDADGTEVEDDDPGEIVVRGANLFSGYWPDGAGGPDDTGWWATGDVAYADEEGDLHLVDRRRDVILVSGFNVYPREVETVLAEHPKVAEVAVIGIPHPYTGESVKALVVPAGNDRPAVAELTDFAARSLARFKCPTTVEFVAELPHGATGKVSKGRLRARSWRASG